MAVSGVVAAVASVVAAILLPGVATAAGLVGWAWYRGWSPSRLRNFALAVLGSTALAAAMTADPIWPYHTLETAIHQAFSGQWPEAVTNAVGGQLILAAVAAWWWWHRYTLRMQSGVAGERSEKYARRQLLRRQREAQRRIRREITPLSRPGRVVLGHRYESTYGEVRLAGEHLLAKDRPWIEIPLDRLQLHTAVIGETGAGKTTLLERLSAGWTEAAWAEYARRSSQGLSGSTVDQVNPRPLTIFVDAKGGSEAASRGFSWAEAMEALGLDWRRIGVFPYADRLNMWNLPARQLRASLHALASTDHEYYSRLQRELLHLVVDAPDGPPTSSVELLRRISPDALRRSWRGYETELRSIEALAASRGGPSPMAADLMLFADLFRLLGEDFDAGRPLEDFDALYISLPGTVDRVVAEAKASVVVELLAYELATSNRQCLFILDEFSAVSGEVAGSVIGLVERLRSLGGAVVVAAQSYEGLAPTPDERERLLGAMGGGMLVMRTQNAGSVARRAGTRRVSEVGRQLAGTEEGLLGTLRRQDSFLLDPNRLRRLPEHHVAYVLPEEVQWGVVTPLDPTRRLPSEAIVESPQRALPPVGDAVPYLQLCADRQREVDERLRGWSA